MSQESYLLEDVENHQKDIHLLQTSWGLLRSRFHIALLIIMIIFSAECLAFYSPYLMRNIINGPIVESLQNPDVTQQDKFNHEIMMGAVYLILLMLGAGILNYLKTILTQYLGQVVIYELREKIIRHVIQLHLDFFKRTPIGRLMTRITYDMDTLSSLFSEGLTEIIGSSLVILFALFFMFKTNVTLTFIALTFMPFLILSTWFFSKKMRLISRSITGEMARMSANVQESIGGMSLIQMYGKQKETTEGLSKINRNFRDQYLRYVFYFSLFMPSLTVIIEIAIICVVGYGSYHIMNGGTDIKIGDITIFPLYLLLLFNPLRELSDRYTQLQKSFSAGERIFHLLSLKTKVEDGTVSNIEHPITIQAKNIHFAYNPNTPILKDVSLNITPGQTIAIVGATGSGKTTLVSLLKKHYLVQEGSVEINGVNIKDITNKKLHQLITFVPQDIFVFSDTIINNIVLNGQVDMERLKHVCEISNASKFIEKLPDQYHSLLNERGTVLSTGQRQLLAFARALYLQPEVLILDEATSNIDTESELLIQDAVKKMMKQTTMVIIAHRLSTIQHANQILVMHQGQIIERGTHNELLKLKGVYSKLCLMQFHLEAQE